ncbi:15925_t:CDS:1 [Funneliformis geosporum]|uniref:11355_t:CDS:1 n=1 Tax=Funneliformis geosporum TaxID=1117311 RepID=A0A9W4T5A1_9GLOM|nr:11355_t:CDS:1 [Funneliformis geosporum]CAI2194252.1 15925_t:CDS:1 [Funneliformis geosporum]
MNHVWHQARYARWQLMADEIFKELGFLPVKNVITPIVTEKIANMMGVLCAFVISSLLHEYLIIGQFDLGQGEHAFFFMNHGVIFILWEAVFGRENKNEIRKLKSS